ncbi:hypothetical protein LshimejAT787_0107680 [Lyophyllum shimeji]|uniref:Alpha/beta-hydrolase n=1 Tax=Lyophyllum shimeji TaxID=47721 RepID=A0A9P3PE90_LYOSH|nr:hypothetical protein LshimejAT787_0107680 [Lyophyllum shimeji]
MDIAELPVPLRQRTLSFYAVLILLVIPLWSTLPLSWGFVIFSTFSRRITIFAWPGPLFAVALCEVLFSIYYFHLSRIISRRAALGAEDPLEIQAAFKRLLQCGLADLPEDGGDEESPRAGSPQEDIIALEPNDRRAVDFRNALRSWFCNAPWSTIKAHEVRQWIYWSIYNADLPPLESLPAAQKAVLKRALELLEKRCGCVFREGSNPAIRPMRLTLDKINILWRPFTFYLILHLVNSFLRIWYKTRWNARFDHHNGLEYFIRMPKHWDPANSPRPIVFIHGLGLGLLQYNAVIRHLFQQFTDRPLLVLLQPQISQHIFHPRYLKPMSRHETADRLAQLLEHLGWVHSGGTGRNEKSDTEDEKEVAHSLLGGKKKGVTMLSHSNGSYTHAWMLKGHPKLISRSCFVDPVTFCSWEGDVCFNFLYRQPKTAMELLMHYFVATELGVANLLHRHFSWTSNTLWFEEIPNARDRTKAFFLLGGKDAIVNAQRVKRYLTSHGVKQGIWYDPDGSHGQALLPGSRGHVEILRWVREADT